MPKIPELYDCLGNVLDEDNIVTVVAPFPLLFKVVACDRGGLHTANGMTPAHLRLVCDINLRKPPGLPFVEVVRVIQPDQQNILDRITEKFPRQ
jgi:hypothetical protein